MREYKGRSEHLLREESNSKGRAKERKLKQILFFSLFLLFLIGGSLFYVWSRIQVIQYGYEISKALKEERALQEINKRLRLEITMLKSYERIEKIATEELRMVKPKADQVIVIR